MELAFEPASGYLAIRIAGAYSLDGVRSAIARTAVEAQRGPYQRVLADVSGLQGEIPDMDRFDYGALAAEELADLERVALVDMPERINHFFEDVARNRGLHVRVFDDRGEALAWITTP